MEFKPRPFTRREFMSKLPEPYVNPDTNIEVVGTLRVKVYSSDRGTR